MCISTCAPAGYKYPPLKGLPLLTHYYPHTFCTARSFNLLALVLRNTESRKPGAIVHSVVFGTTAISVIFLLHLLSW